MGVVIRQSIKGTIVTYVGAFIGFINTLFISAKFLTPEEIGLTRILIESATILVGLSQLGVLSSGIRFFPHFKTEDAKHRGYFFYLCIVPLLGVAFFYTIYVGFKIPINSYFSAESPLFTDYYFWVLPIAFFTLYMSVFEVYSNVLMRIAFPRFIREVAIRVFTILIILIYHFGWVNLNGFVLLLALVYALGAIMGLIYVACIGKVSMKHCIKTDIPQPLRKEMSVYSLFCVFVVLSNLIAMRIDVFMVSAKMGLEFTAVFSIAYYMAAIIEMPSRSSLSISAPLIAEAYKNKNMERVKFYYQRVSLNQFVVGLLIMLLLWINLKNVYAMMPNGDYYVAGMYVVFFIALAKITDTIGLVSNSILSYSSYYKYTVFFLFLLAFLTVISNNIFIPIWGVSGAALASFITIFVYNIGLVSFVAWKLKIHPFSIGMLKALVLILVLIGLHALWPSMLSPILDSLLRSFVIGGIAVGGIYFMKVSEEINGIMDKVLIKIRVKH